LLEKCNKNMFIIGHAMMFVICVR